MVKTILMTLLAIALVILPFTPFLLLNARKAKALERRKAFLSEDYVGYSTKYGDAAGDFSPLAQITVQEVKEIGEYLGLPINLVDKVPSDGLSGKTDEDNLGFTYAALDRYIREGVCEDEAVKAKIDRLHIRNEFKLKPIPSFPYKP